MSYRPKTGLVTPFGLKVSHRNVLSGVVQIAVLKRKLYRLRVSLHVLSRLCDVAFQLVSLYSAGLPPPCTVSLVLPDHLEGGGQNDDVAWAVSIELMQLEMFVAMAEGSSILKASERVFRTQPAVSIALKRLENEINAKLFDRLWRHEFRLTEVGEAFYGYATRPLSLRSEAMSAVAELARVRTGRLRVGANESISINLLPRLTQAFLGRYPGVLIEAQCDRSSACSGNLRTGGLI